MVDTNTKLCDYLVNAADDVCAKVTPINKRYETKFKNDPNIKRIKYLLGKQYDPNQYILKVLDDANHKNGIGGMKKTTYYKMLAVAHNLNHETKEMENSALYAMNKIHEGKLAATNLQKKYNKERASKACYIRNILLEKENEDDKKNKDENKEKVKESINDDTNTEPLKPDVNLDSVDAIQPSTVIDDNEPIINNVEDTKTLSEPNQFTDHNNQKENTDKTNIESSKNTKGSMGQGTQKPNSSSSIPEKKDNDINTSKEKYGNTKAKRNITRKITHHRKHRNPNDPYDVSEEYDIIEEIDDEEDESNEHLETEKIALDEENGTREESDKGINTSVKRPKNKHYRKRIDPKDGKEITEEYETSDEEEDINSNNSGEKKSNETPESELLDNDNNEHDKETPEHLETEKVVSDEEDDEGINTSVKRPKKKHYRKRIDPKDGKEITEEYETSDEEDDINSNKSGEEKSNEAPESELLDNADNEHDKETPEHLETEKLVSDEENATREESDEGINTSVKRPKKKHYRKRIDPKDGKEITEEYETSDEEEDINSNNSGEKKSNETPESELLDNDNNEHDKETPEHLETEKVVSDEEDDEGINTLVKRPKKKHYRKRIDPKDGKEITEEYETSDEEDDINSNKSGEEKSNEAPESELLDNADNEHDKETPEHLETEKLVSDEENATREESDEGINTSVKRPKKKHYRKRIDPKDGKEITDEYETSDEEDDINSNKSGEEKSNEAPESELLDNADNEHDKETPEHLETEKLVSDEENATREESDEGINTSVKRPKNKHYRKRIDPKDGKEITEEYETSDEEDDINSNKSGEEKSNEAPESELLDNADNEHDTETPEHLETEKVVSDEEDDEGINTSVKRPKKKHYRKRIDPKDGKEITEEYETSDEEDDINSNKSGEEKSNQAPESELLDNADNEHDKEKPEHLETEKLVSDEENASREESDEGINTSVKRPKNKHYRKRIDPKDGKEITEEYETSDEEEYINSNNSGEKKSNETTESELLDNDNNEHDKETPEHLETEKLVSDEENDEGISTLVKRPKKKHYRKSIDPKDGKEITEEYETSDEEDDINSNKSGEEKSNEAPESELLDNADNEHDKETPEHLETEKLVSDEENATREESDEGINMSVKRPKNKHYRKRIDPKDGKEITEEYETSDEEDDINSNKSGEKKSKDNVADVVPENSTREISELDDNENLNSVEGAELYGVDNEKIIPAADSMGEDSSSVESSYEEPEQSYINDSNNSHKKNNEQYNSDDQSNKISKGHRKQKYPKNGQEISDEYDIVEKQDDESDEKNDGNKKPNKQMRQHVKPRDLKDGQDVSEEYDPVSNKIIDTPTGESDGELTDHEIETPEYEDVAENEETPKNNESPDHYQSKEHDEIDENEPERRSNEELNESNDIDQQNDRGNQPNKKMRRRRKRKDPKDGQEVSEEYDPVSNKIIDTPNGESDGELTDHEIETPEYEDVAENEETPENDETPDHYQSKEHDGIDENEPERRSNEELNESNDIDQQNDRGNQPNKKMRRRRKRKDPKDGQEVSEEYDPVSNKIIDTPNGESDGELTDHEIETPEYEDVAENEETPENNESPDHYQSKEHDEIDENEPERRSNEELNESNDIDQQNDRGNQPNKKMRRRRKRKDPKDGQEVSEEYDPVSNKIIDTPNGESDGELTDHEIETPEYEDVAENEETPENNESPDHYQSKEHDEIDENEPERRSNEELNESNGIDQQNDGRNQPNRKMRRHRKRKDHKDGQEVSEEYDPVSNKIIDTPNGESDGELTDHEIETPEYEDVAENEETPENDETPDHYQSKEHDEIDENEPERRSNEELNESNGIDQQNDGRNQPNRKMRRHRKRKDHKDGQEVSEEYDPVSNKIIDTPNGESDAELTDHEIETPEYEDVAENEETPENDETPDHYQSKEHDEIDENEPERRSNEELNESNGIDQQNDGKNQPNRKMRRHRKRKDPKDGQEVSEEYDPVSNKIIDTPNGESDGELTDHEIETPEYEDVAENEETPENNESPDHYQSKEHDEIDENEPERRSNEELNESNDIDQQNNRGNQPNKKMRRRRKRKDPKDGQEVSEEYDPVSNKIIDTPNGESDGELTDHEIETPEYEDVAENEETPENDETPDHYQSKEHDEIDENEPERRSNEELNESNDIDQQNDRGNQPNKKMRRRRKHKDPKDGQEVSEEYDPVSNKIIDTPNGESDGELTDHEIETPEYEDVAENEETPENDETPDHYQSKEHDEIDENEPERRSNEELNESNDIDQQNDGRNQPNRKMRRHRKRKDPKYDHELSEEYDTIEVQEDEPPLLGENSNTLPGEPEYKTEDELDTPENDEIPEYNQSNKYAKISELEPDFKSNEGKNNPKEIAEQNNLGNYPNKKIRHHRKRKDPLHSLEISEEYDTIEEEDGEINKLKTPNIVSYDQFDKNPISSPNNENNANDENNLVNPLKHKPKRFRNRINPEYDHEISEEFDSFEEYDEDAKLKKHPFRREIIDKNRDFNNNVIPNIDNDVSENALNTGYDEPTVVPQTIFEENKEEDPELSEYSENSDLTPEASSPNDVDETIDVTKPRPRKVRRHKKSRQPKTVNEIYNEPEVVNNVQEELPGTGNGETTDIDDEIEQPQLSEYSENSDLTPEASSPNDVDETIDVTKPRPRKVRRHKKSRQPKTVNEIYNEPEVVNNVQEELPGTGNGETTDIDDEIEQPELSEYSENSDLTPEASSPNDVDETIDVTKPRPRKVRRHKKSRQPKTVNEIYNEPEVVNNVQEELPGTGNGETTDIDDEIEQPQLSEYSENSDLTPEASSPNDVDETIDVTKPRPRKVRRHKKSRQPKTVNEIYNEPEVVNNVQEELPGTGNGETTDIDDEIEQPELSEYSENSDLTPEASSPNDVDETIDVTKPRPRKVRRHKKSRQPKTVNEIYNEPEVVNNVQEELPGTGNGETTDIDDEIEQPELSEYSENSDLTPEASSPNDVNETIDVTKPRQRKVRRHKKSRQPKTVNENYNETEDPKRIPTQNNEHVNYEENPGENEKTANLNDTDGTMNSKQPRRKKHVRRKKIPTTATVDEITPNSLDKENRGIQNDNKSVENPEIQPNDTGRNPPKKRRLRRIRTYMVNKDTNERIPINDQTYSTTDGLPDTPKNKLEATEIEDSDDPDSNEDNDDYSSFLFKEYNSDQCKRDAYDRFKKVTSQDAKQIAYRSVLDTSEMRSNMLATIKNAIANVKVSKTLNDVDQSLRTVSYSLKTGLKQTVSDLVTKVIPLAKDFLKTADNLKELYKNGPQSTHKMLCNILENESTVPDSAKDVLKLISPKFDVDKLINNIFEKPFNTKSLKEKKVKAQRKLISLSKHMDTAISNIDCFVLSAMSAVGIGADTLKLLKSGRVIMSDKHPRSKALRDAVGIIKSGKKIRNNDVGFTPTLTPSDGFNESDEDDDDEDPDQVAQKNEEFLKTVPDLDDNIPIPKKVPNKRQSLGVIVVHPDKQIEYKEVTDTSQLKKFVGDQTKKYKLQSKNKHLKFLKLNSKKLVDSMVADVKKKAERNGMSKKEMVEEIIKNLKSS
ncbi:putative uncharacterized protein DDB_G0282133 isoform X1 [Acyrthosiphon pisum]|uniref:Uncharacterized protein n=1 Tax=Acyrthosiphon pisum TaxID=7029 RepID=A0A8R1WZJ2_ACYPI|nr:putative uncharacterized protein DDB_G0282133 isoform X1 [Acyrthosiphon pisum]|eukprot:XP_008180572.2 PREDICTED: putative uncharacterized protein DDB_G0282133 isoform X1 [Acyrthosiphon pisum]